MNAEVMDILGFIAHDIVIRLTETALIIKKEWELIEAQVFDPLLQDSFLFGKPPGK